MNQSGLGESRASTFMNDLLVIGRGDSVRSFTGWGDYTDTMAVSSGIFAIPEEHRPPTHFVAMDEPKWFLHPLHEPDYDFAWQHSLDNWAFWKDERIQKHVPEARNRRGGYRELPSEIWDVIPDEYLPAFQRELGNHLHLFGSQTGWGDFSNVTGWKVEAKPPSFDNEPLGMVVGDKRVVRNSWYVAIQVAYRLGYRRLFFIGCDFSRREYEATAGIGTMRLTKMCWELAKAAGMEWINLAPESVLAEFLPTPNGVLK